MNGAPKYNEEYFNVFYALLVTFNCTVVAALALVSICVCCKKRRFPKNELLGLEGMVKLKNPDELINVTTAGVATGQSESQGDLNHSVSTESEKRASTAAHRSLPDIPVTDDTGSELYETVAEKQLVDLQKHHDKVVTNLKKQSSISQHSSISQVDDSPYSRVKNAPHDYAKVRNAEHPYAQLNQPSTSAAAAAAAVVNAGNTAGTPSQLTLNDSLHRSSHHEDSSEHLSDAPAQVEIPAASAIAGMVSASQDLPYMTPPIAYQHFNGDSPDSSKGYTSISVREPLANILAQQPPKMSQRLPPLLRDVSDSHYATVSDDSDETYAAIDDPTGRVPTHTTASAGSYTSGSETYAQIQPTQSSSIVVAVEINNASTSNIMNAITPVLPPTIPTQHCEQNMAGTLTSAAAIVNRRPNSEHITPVLPPVDSLRAAQMHSRQASSSSNNSSSLGQLVGSPKPEKRQANSPLPPTPKSTISQMHSATTSSSNLTSGRNSVISVIELSAISCGGSVDGAMSTGTEGSPQKKQQSNHLQSPSKDIEGMYAKVIKKNKFSHHSPTSQDNSPILARKCDVGLTSIDKAAAALLETHKISGDVGEKYRKRSNSYGAKDHGYETIPAETMRGGVITGLVSNNAGSEQRKSDCYTQILQKERQEAEAPLSVRHRHTDAKLAFESADYADDDYQPLQQMPKHYESIASGKHNNSISKYPGFEILEKPKLQGDGDHEKKSDYDPNYEVLKEPMVSTGLSDDGYAKVLEKKRLHQDSDSNDGYSKVRGEEVDADTEAGTAGYSTIGEVKNLGGVETVDGNHNYASILEAKLSKVSMDAESDHYASIGETAPINTTLIAILPLSEALPSPNYIQNSPPASSTNINKTASTSTPSLRQTPSSSQYESLTGSETDPYESLSYQQMMGNTNAMSIEHPYEQLQSEYSDSALTTPEEQYSLSNSSSKTITTETQLSANGRKPIQISTTTELSTEVVVDDYFQV